jgi:hypothetical protein
LLIGQFRRGVTEDEITTGLDPELEAALPEFAQLAEEV